MENNVEQQQARTSIASVDARVARLEAAQAETDNKIGLIQLEQTHTRELMTARFATLETGQIAQTQKLDQFIMKVEGLIMESIKGSGDLTASPAGRQVQERLVRLEAKAEVHESWMDQIRGMSTVIRWVIGTSVIGFLTSIVSLLTTAGVIGN